MKSAVARKRNRYSEALELGRLALGWSDPEFDPIAHCKLLQSLGNIYNNLENGEEALGILLDGVKVLEEHGLSSNGTWLYLSTAEQYLSCGEIDRGHEILDRLESILGYEKRYMPESPDRILISAHTVRANLLVKQQEYHRARELLEWCIESFNALGLHVSEVVACALAAFACGGEDDAQGACSYLERAIAVSAGSSRLHQLRIRLELAHWKLACDLDEEASALLDEIEPELSGNKRYYVQLLRLRATIAEKAGDALDALKLERQAAETEREYLERGRDQSVRNARILAETSLLEQTIGQERERRHRVEHELAAAMIELGEKRRMIRDVASRLKTELSRKERMKTEQGSGRRNSSLRAILSDLSAGEINRSPRLSYLGDVGDEFVQRLRRIHPKLARSQERLCVLLRAGLNAGEICTLLNIGSEGLKSRRKRLRKTLGVPKGKSLEKVIAEV
jgi:hypothetical protein